MKRAGRPRKAKQLAAALDSRLDRKESSPAKPGPPPRFSSRSGKTIRATRAGSTSNCRAVFPLHGRTRMRLLAPVSPGEASESLGVTSWGAVDLRTVRDPCPQERTRVSPLGPGQRRGWPLFGGAQQEKFARATGRPRHTRAARASGSPTRPRAEEAARRCGGPRGGLAEEPRRRRPGALGGLSGVAGSPGRLPGVSGFALFALHRVGAWWLGSLDRDWLASFRRKRPPRCAAQPRRRRAGRQPVLPDETRYYELPWTILATEEVYRNAGIFRKVRAVQWLERALAPGASLYELTGRERTRRSPPKRCSPCGRGEA